MAPHELEGKTLGEKHHHYNKLVKEALDSHKQVGSGVFNTDDDDVENLMKIDIACKKRDVDFIIKVYKCEDMLYVSRAIKNSTWLITETQFSNIINPNYLYTQLFPHMTSRAISKLLLHIRLNLKDETRVESFYNFYKEKDVKTAVKWLPYCSLTLIEKEVEQNATKIDTHLLKRLCERSITVLEKFIDKCEHHKRDKLEATMFLINTEPDRYLDILEKMEVYQMPSLGAKQTEKIMKKCPQRIIEKFDKYYKLIDTETFAKCLKKEDLKDFLSKQAEKKEMDNWFNYDNLKCFINCMPKESRFDFIKKYIIEKKKDEQSAVQYDSELCSVAMKCLSYEPSSNTNVYHWYRFASFETAFPEIIKLIRAESSPNERIEMFDVLLICARRNPKHIKTLLQYYHDKHINEPFNFKLRFVNNVIFKTNVYNFDESTWAILNKIFYSMEVYMESDQTVQLCIGAIIVYNILHNQPVPEIIEKKFVFNSLKAIQKKLDKEKSEKVFKYLYDIITKKVTAKTINSENDFTEAVSLLKDVLLLLKDWNKELIDYPWLVGKIREYIQLKHNNSWKTDLSSLYNTKKTWRKTLFQESLELSPSDETFYNALKHGPELLVKYKTIIDMIQVDDKISLKHSLSTLRQYWPKSLANNWAASYLARLEQTGGHKALIRGLCAILPQKQIIEIIKKYAPKEQKINWSEDDEVVLSMRKQLGLNMYLTRPHPSPEVVLLYAKGDYLQFVLPSLNSVLHNMSSMRIRDIVKKLLDAPVSLQKHGIRHAFNKLETEELKQVFSDIWKTTKNASIRAVLFKQTFNLLCREKNPGMIEEIWELLKTFIENLSSEENKTIYELLGKIDKVPLLVKGKFFMKSFKYLKSLPAKANCDNIVNDLSYKMPYLMEDLESDFVESIILESLDKHFTTTRYRDSEIVAAYLLCCKDEKSQTDKFEKVLLPTLQRSFPLWNVKCEGCVRVGSNITDILNELSRFLLKFAFEKKMIIPTKLFNDIFIELEKNLPVENHYLILRKWKLTAAFAKSLQEHQDFIQSYKVKDEESNSDTYYDPCYNCKWNDVYLKAVPKFTEICVQYLKEDLQLFFPSIYLIFAEALENACYYIHKAVYLECLYSFLRDETFIESYLLVLKNMKDYSYGEEEEEVVKKIREKIFANPSAEIKIHYYRKFKRHDLDDKCY